MKQQEVERMYVQYYQVLRRIAFRILKDAEESEDAVQSTFVRLVKTEKEHTFDNSRGELNFLAKITKNICYSMLKKNDRDVLFEEAENIRFVADKHCDIAKESSTKATLEQLSSIVPDYNILELYYIYGYNTVQISKILGISEASVRQKMCRARKSARKILDKAIA